MCHDYGPSGSMERVLAHQLRKKVLQGVRVGHWRTTHALDWHPASAPPIRNLPVPLTVALVYRQCNAGVVQEILKPLMDDPLADLRLWALDYVDSSLEPYTVGSGPAAKFPLVTRLLDTRPVPAGNFVAVCDDDVVFVRGGWGELLRVLLDARFDLAQPAHERPKNFSHWMTVRRAASVARRTKFVEIGPIFVIGPSVVTEIRQDMRTASMGWGLEATWYRRAGEGVRLGIIDVVTVDHLAYPGTAYDNAAAEAELAARLADAHVLNLRTLRVVEQRWSSRDQAPPW